MENKKYILEPEVTAEMIKVGAEIVREYGDVLRNGGHASASTVSMDVYIAMYNEMCREHVCPQMGASNSFVRED